MILPKVFLQRLEAGNGANCSYSLNVYIQTFAQYLGFELV